ncbi:hypothetical protein EBU95_15640 [bacterium]|nr:hypothetical protein [bacterium]
MSIMELVLWLAFLVLSIILWVRKPNNTIHYSTVPQVIDVRIEKIKDTLYLWDMKSEEFLAQGSSIEEAAAVLKQRFPDTRFRVVGEVNEQ